VTDSEGSIKGEGTEAVTVENDGESEDKVQAEVGTGKDTGESDGKTEGEGADV